jgi:hypothetical protein
MERNKIIFSGQSHTFGLGLEWELDPELNSEEYLKNGIHIPIPILKHYQKYWRQYRWPTLICNELGYEQFNVHDVENHIKKIGADSVQTIWMMVKNEENIQDLLASTKYIILEVGGHVRWYDEELHGGIDGDKYPNTILEMIDLINNPLSDDSIVSKTLDWINKIDPNIYTIEMNNKIQYLIKKYPEITFLILPWQTDKLSISKSKPLKDNIIKIEENGKIYNCVNSFLVTENLQVYRKAKGFNGDYKYNHIEEHASIEGHQRVANMVINYIKKLENEKR